jgi:hypothetical protein
MNNKIKEDKNFKNHLVWLINTKIWAVSKNNGDI